MSELWKLGHRPVQEAAPARASAASAPAATHVSAPEAPKVAPGLPPLRPKRVASEKWGLAFLGSAFYVAVEYMRLPAMFPILQPLQIGKIAMLVAFVGILSSPKLMSLPSDSLRRTSDLVIPLFILATAASSLFAYDTWRALNSLFGAVIWYLIYIMLSRSLATAWALRAWIAWWLLVNFKLAQFAIRSYRYVMATSSYSEMTIMSYGFGGGSTGFFGNSADFGVAMCVVWPVGSYLILARVTKWKRAVLVLFSLAYLGAILICGSRGAVVGAAVVALIVLLRSPKKIPAIVMLLVLAPAIYFFLPNATKERFQSAMSPEKDKTAHHRLVLWKAGLKMLADHPLFGVGPACYGVAYVRGYGGTYDPYQPDKVWVPHSAYIELVSQWGFVGIVPMLLIWLQIFRTNADTRRRLKRLHGKDAFKTYEFCLALGLDFGFIGYLVSGAFVAVLMYPHIWLLLGVSTALHANVLRESNAGNVTAKPTPALQFAAR